jgi:uracil-DNA glycosylase
MNIKLEPSWKKHLEQEFSKNYFQKLTDFVKSEYLSDKTIYPPPKQIFRAFALTPFDQVKVVILGQDPYHGPNQAHGLCFSVNQDIPIPPSLQNIYKEIESDLGITPTGSGDLKHWAKQGVLLLNATLTVEAHQAGSHQNKGWEEFTDAAIKTLSDQRENLVFMLWGSYAQKKGHVIDTQKHLILKTAHPSPLSAYRGFFGCEHFSRANHYLIEKGIEEIEW